MELHASCCNFTSKSQLNLGVLVFNFVVYAVTQSHKDQRLFQIDMVISSFGVDMKLKSIVSPAASFKELLCDLY